MTALLNYIERVGIAVSVLVNVLLGGASNQTFSARNWHWKRNGKLNLVWIIDAVLGRDHCSDCWSYWIVRRNKW